jgi:hypothetical protein
MSFYVVEEGRITGNSKQVAGPFATREAAQIEANRLCAYATGFTIGLEQSMGPEALYARSFASYRVVEK